MLVFVKSEIEHKNNASVCAIVDCNRKVDVVGCKAMKSFNIYYCMSFDILWTNFDSGENQSNIVSTLYAIELWESVYEMGQKLLSFGIVYTVHDAHLFQNCNSQTTPSQEKLGKLFSFQSFFIKSLITSSSVTTSTS